MSSKFRWPRSASALKSPSGTWLRSILALEHRLVRQLVHRLVRRHGRLHPGRIGCLLAVLIIAGVWALTQTLEEVSALAGHHPTPVAGSPFDTITTPRPHSGSPTIDRILLRGKLIVAVQDIPGLAQRSPTTEDYTGFDIALAHLIAHNLGVDPTHTSFKPLTPRIREPALLRGETDLLLDYEITPEHSTQLSIAGPYLVQQGTEYGIGLPPHDPVIHQRITTVLRQAINDGTWTRLYTQYLPTPAPTPPTPR